MRLIALTLAAALAAPAVTAGELPAALFKQIVIDNYAENEAEGCPAYAGPHCGTPQKPSDIEFATADLNDDGKPEYFVAGQSGWCGSAGCVLWIYQQSGAHYSQIYNGESRYTPNQVQMAIQRTKTNGYRDLFFKTEYPSHWLVEFVTYDDGAYKTYGVFDPN